MDGLSKRLDFAIDAALTAGRLTLEGYLGPPPHVDWKADASPVTPYDKASEKLIRELIAAHFPNDAILGEEFGETPGTSGYRWILDPIDGTRHFASQMPGYGVLVGLEHTAKPGAAGADGSTAVAGVAYMPALREIMWAARGMGAWWAREVEKGEDTAALVKRAARTQVPAGPELAQASVISCTLKSWTKIGRDGGVERLRQRVRRLQSGGFNCYDYVLLASGRIDIALDPVMKSWDLCALKPIVEEAGGVFTSIDGENSIYANSSLAANPVLHAQALELMRAH